MLLLVWILLAAPPLAAPLFAQSACPSVEAWSPCDFAFDLEAGENPAQAQLRAEFRSPHHRTYLLPAVHEDGRLILRFTPTEDGDWEYRITSNLPRLDGKTIPFHASPSDSPGFVHVANVHHFATENNKPHLWMSTPLDHFTTMPRAEFDRLVDQRAKEKFTHLRVTLDFNADLREAAGRVRAINRRGMVADLVLESVPLDREQRERYVTDIAARFDAFNITWMGVPAFEDAAEGRAVMKDTGALLKRLDPYNHPRTTLATGTSSGLLSDDWMTMIAYGTADPNVGAVEHQLFQAPAINTGIQNQRDLWNATMNGQYPASGDGEYMTAWFEFMAGNRYWELEPYFGVDGGRALALEGVEYIVYVEKPGPVEVTVEKHGYDVAWINPATGERVKEKKGYNGEHFTGEPPDKSHDWVLHISREGTKEGMLHSYKFESRPAPIQEVEQSPEKVPFEIAAPDTAEISLSHPLNYSLKIKRETRGTRSLLVEWTGEVVADGRGYRVIGAGTQGTLRIPASIVRNFPAVFNVHVAVLNANGKAYTLDRAYRLVQ